MTTMDDRVMAEAGRSECLSGERMPTSIERSLAIPECAQDAEVATDENGSLVIRWNGSLYSDGDDPDMWEISLSPDGTTVHVHVDVDGPGWLSEIQETIRTVIQSRSIYVHLCMGWIA
jgi:hypothetical protein